MFKTYIEFQFNGSVVKLLNVRHSVCLLFEPIACWILGARKNGVWVSAAENGRLTWTTVVAGVVRPVAVERERVKRTWTSAEKMPGEGKKTTHKNV